MLKSLISIFAVAMLITGCGKAGAADGKVSEPANTPVAENTESSTKAFPVDPTLISPDGKKCTLTSLLGKKVVYIDIWATWCGPCCREIPYLDKLVESYKGNDKIEFVSISCDQDAQAWLRKIGNDRPSWPQYIFSADTGFDFMKSMGIQGIPRFMIIGKNGKIVDPDAIRPSDPLINQYLDKIIEHY